MLRPILLAALIASVAACSGPNETPALELSSELRGITQKEALAELDQIADAVRAYYGPLQYKMQRFGLDFEREVETAKQDITAGKTEGDRVRPVYELLAKLKDGHVSYSYPLPSDQSVESSFPLLVTPVDGSFVVAAVGGPLARTVARGDVLVSVDGLSTTELEEMLLPLNEIGTPESSLHWVALGMTVRPFYAPEKLQPQGETAHVVLKNAAGEEYAVDAPWRNTKGGLAGQIQPPLPTPPAATTKRGLAPGAAFSGRVAYLMKNPTIAENDSLLQFGASTPYFLTAAVQAKLNIVPVSPKTETLKTFGVTVPEGDDTASDTKRFVWFRAYKYAYNGKTIMLVRIPSFEAPLGNYDENVAWLGALLKDNLEAAVPGAALADKPADTVVLDVTHNPGGTVAYLQGLTTLFATKAFPNFVQANHADRTWISAYIGAANASDAVEQPIWVKRTQSVETAYDVGNWLAPFAPITGSYQGPTVPRTAELDAGTEMLSPHPLVHWNKPVVVLHDELSGSAGDAFPAILQNAHIATTFGARTMGLGGTVEQVLTLPYSRAELRLTRGLNAPFHPEGTPGAVALIENNGVTPDHPYAHTIEDFRGGFVAFATAFSEVASKATRE